MTQVNDFTSETVLREQRIKQAAALFDNNFHKDGNPKTIYGIMLFFRYGWFDHRYSVAGKILFKTAAFIYKASLLKNKIVQRLRRK